MGSGWSIRGRLFGLWLLMLIVVSMIVFKVVDMFIMKVRVSEEEEFEGSDLAECGMEAYPEFSSTR